MSADPALDPQLQPLINQLQQAQAALQAHLGNGAGRVVDPATGRTLLLPAAQQALLESEAQNRTLAEILQNVRDCIITADVQGCITYWNEGATLLMGYTAAEMVGQPIATIYPDQSGVVGILQQVHAGGEYRAEMEATRKDGSTVWVDLRVTAMVDAGGHLTGTLGVSKDINERKRAALALAESETRFATLFNSSPAAISLTRIADGQLVDVNKAFEVLVGHNRWEIVGNTATNLNLWPIPSERDCMLAGLKAERAVRDLEITFRRQDGQLVDTVTSLEIIALGGADYVIGISQDLTGVKQVEAAIRESENRFQLISHATNDAVWDWNIASNEGWWSDAFYTLFGYSRDEVTTDHQVWIDNIHPADRDDVVRRSQEALNSRADIWNAEYRFRRKDGTYADIIDRGYVVRDANGQAVRMLGSMSDISQRKQADAQIRFQAHLLDTVGQAVVASDLTGKVIYWNSSAEKLYGRTEGEMLGRSALNTSDADAATQQAAIYQRLRAGSSWSGEMIAPRGDGTPFPVFVTISPLHDDAGQLIGSIGVSTDISSVKKAEQTLKDREARFRALIENSADGIILVDGQGYIEYVSPPTTRLLGYRPEELVGTLGLTLIHPDDVALATANLVRSASTPRQIEWAEYRTRHKDGSWRWMSGSIQNLVDEPSVGALIVNFRDITERKQAELENQQRTRELATIADLSTSLRTAVARSQILSILLDQIMALFRAEGTSLVMPDPGTREWVVELGKGAMVVAMGSRYPYNQGASRLVMESGQPYLADNSQTDTNLYQAVAPTRPLAALGVPLITQNQPIGVLWLGRTDPIRPDEVRLLVAMADIAANAIQRATAHEQTQRHLTQLQSLRAIDQVIKSSMDLRLTLSVLLEHILGQSGLDAADILLLNKHNQTLEYASGRGFRTTEIQNTRLRLGEGWAGQAALQRQMVSELNLQATAEPNVRRQVWVREDFKVYFGVPLIAKGQVLGVLDIFNRSPFQPNEEWLDFLSALADQAAIAINNSQLFESLQRTNMELSLAYNATIEGWSHALDLRDKETEGHSRRVTELTVELARLSGSFNAQDINYIRWGALLHDIGKMGIPDHILLKPSPLTDDEWAIMRRHPAYAFELLSPIAYLKPALDIPYCHHEKWDGSGYPRGLKGNSIPLAARLFTVVDVWDALRSDRPYRAAWSEEKVRDHLTSLSGTQFDPHAVNIFLSLGDEVFTRLSG